MTKSIGFAVIMIGAAWWVLAAGGASPSTQPAAQPSTQPAQELVLDLGNNVTLKLALIPAGRFTMGSMRSEQERFTQMAIAAGIDQKLFNLSDEGPQHEVKISQPFYMGVHEVTRGQFAQFVADTGYSTDAEKEGKAWGWDGTKFAEMRGYSWRKTGFDQTDDHPVVNVSWNDATAFCKWLSTKAGRSVHLPSEAQWEYACRGGKQTAYPWGDDPDDGKGWCNAADQSAKRMWKWVFNWDDGYVYTSPVGSFRPNAFGLYDMIGNAWEWCADWYDKDYYANANNTDPQGPASGTYRVLRGGCWGIGPMYCRSAYRVRYSPGFRYVILSVGFRVSVDLK